MTVTEQQYITTLLSHSLNLLLEIEQLIKPRISQSTIHLLYQHNACRDAHLRPSRCTEDILIATTHGQHLLLITFSTRGISSSGFLLFVRAYIHRYIYLPSQIHKSTFKLSVLEYSEHRLAVKRDKNPCLP